MKSWIVLIAVFGVLVGFCALGDAYVRRAYGVEVGANWKTEAKRLVGKIELQKFVSTKDGKRMIAVSKPHPLWTIPSGPSVYVIDESDRVVDFSIDVGQKKGVLQRIPEVIDVLGTLPRYDDASVTSTERGETRK